MHTLLASGTTVEFLFHMLQKQIAQNYADPKLIEMLVYLVQAIARFDRTYGKTSYCAEIRWRYESESPVDVDSFRNWLETREIDLAKHTPSKEVSGWLRDALWQEVQVTECPSQVPERSVCGLLVHILKDPGVSKEMHSLVEATMQWMLRDDHPEDKECLSVQEEDTHVNSAAQNQANQALSSLSSNLDKFLDMYGSENESETEVNEKEVVSLV